MRYFTDPVVENSIKIFYFKSLKKEIKRIFKTNSYKMENKFFDRNYFFFFNEI